jgi:hypothetical protein
MEHRWGKRVGVDMPVKISAHPFVIRHGRLLNVSVSGAALSAGLALRRLSRIEVAIDLPHRTRSASASIPAYVTRVSKDSVGIEWCQFAPRPIAQFLQSLSRRPNIRLRKPEPNKGHVSHRMSEPLLKHGT